MSTSGLNVLLAQLAVLVAKSDGSISSTEASAIKKWVDEVTKKAGGNSGKIKQDMNRAMQQAYSGDRSLESICADLEAINDKESMYEAIKLCCQIMFVDGFAEKNELDIINKIESVLELKREDVREIFDRSLVTLNPIAFEGLTDEEIIGVDPSWTNQEKIEFIADEFARWNNRGATEEDREKLANINALKQRCARLLEEYKT